MKGLLLFSLISLASCTSEIVTEESSFSGTTTTTATPKMYEGKYRVAYKERIDQNGNVERYFPIGSVDPNPEVDGWMSETIFTFTKDSLGISQLMQQGWQDGSVSLKWKSGVPTRVGCRWVESANEAQLSWYQDNLIIKNYLEKL